MVAQKKVPLDISNKNIVGTVIGGTAIFSFIVIWMSSIASPLLFYASIQHQNYAIATLIFVLVICAYVPWKKGFISKNFTAFVSYTAFYYKRCSITFEGSSLPEDSKTPVFYAVHPHGAFCLGWSALFIAPFMSSVRFCFSPVLYFSPFFKLWSRMTGNPGRADKEAMIQYMEKGEHLALPPGGFEEATLTSPAQDRVYIKNRLGFIKLCLMHGYSVVPVYCFGENYTFNNAQGLWKMRLGMNSLGIPTILIWGASFFPLLPKRHEYGLYIVAGEPLVLPKVEKPSREDVKMWHDKYIAALTRVFEEHKCDAYGEEGKTKKLELW
mmetsp:Transcript_130/g.171  ORF Transcript_130/g.171 Transcript_130/m.171 type:complete len:325 (+) Transcript_130:119-1093(+)